MKTLLVISLFFVLVSAASASSVYPLVTQLAGGTVKCESPEEWATDLYVATNSRGYTLPGQYIALGPTACGGLLLFLADPNQRLIRGYYTREGEALLTFLHERGHLHGELNEAKVECAAIRGVTAFALAHGATKANARWLYAAALSGHRRTPPSYQTIC